MFYLYLFISTALYAQVSSPADCSPLEKERQCFTHVCKPELSPASPEKVEEAFNSGAISLNPVIQQRTSEYQSKMRGTSQFFLREISKLNANSLVRNFLTDGTFPGVGRYGGGFDAFREFFEPNVILRSGRVITNTVSSSAEIFNKLGDFIQGQNALDQVVGTLMDMVVRKTKLSAYNDIQRSQVDFIFERMIKDYPQNRARLLSLKDKLKADEILDRAAFDDLIYKYERDAKASYRRENRQVILQAIQAQIEEYKNTDWALKIKNTIEPCRIATYFEAEARKKWTAESFRKAVSSAMQDIRKRFLPLLSESTRINISSLLHEELITLEILPPVEISYVIPEAPTNLSEAFIQMKDLGMAKCHVDRGIGSRIDHTNRIYISPVDISMGSPDVIHHEIGHFISTMMLKNSSPESYLRFQRLRQCLSSMHENSKLRPNRHEGDRHYTEEDFSDWFAGMTSPEPSRVHCGFRTILTDLKDFPLYDSSKLGNHSSSLFRHLHIMAVRNEPIPSVCREMMEGRSDQVKKCEL